MKDNLIELKKHTSNNTTTIVALKEFDEELKKLSLSVRQINVPVHYLNIRNYEGRFNKMFLDYWKDYSTNELKNGVFVLFNPFRGKSLMFLKL